MAHVAVVLSGSGVYDGSEIHEAVITLLRLSEKGAKVTIFAPDVKQMHVINHLTGKESRESRKVLAEAARIARGTIKPLSKATARYDALIMPGGFGAAKNLSNFAVSGAKCRVNRDLEKLILAFHKAGKPIAPMCISPTVVARVLGKAKIRVKLTIGNDPGTAAAINKMGAEHVECPVDDVVVDRKNKIVSAPAYMYDASIADVAKGIRKLVDTTLKMVK